MIVISLNAAAVAKLIVPASRTRLFGASFDES